MKNKNQRLSCLADIIQNNRVETQDVLLKLMREKGFDITQGTLSRDLRMLRVSKMSDGWSSYYYTIASSSDDTDSLLDVNYIDDVKNGIISIEFNGFIGVIKTRRGHAQSVCAALDVIKLPEILGTIAGDDTIFLVLREGATRETLLEDFRKTFPDTE